ncbi:TetR family transcriptional regulator [Actinophytocola glycyrrhizae]|uniref:TetR family transcriptional regulator n=1 Tax=Actinophytocola glycyrrhizae TaxID=2044873 RepID=A0ABV9RSN2_9PSEU
MNTESRTGRRPGRPPSLTRNDVARAALAEGLANLSMPTVARRLGVSHSTLYRYVHDRDDLLLAALDLALREFDWPGTDHLGWRELMVSFADALWRFLERHPGMAETSLMVPSMPGKALGIADQYVVRLRAEGLNARDAVIAVDYTADLTIAAEIGVRRMSRVFDTPRGRRSLRELYEGPDASRFERRGWLDDKLTIMLDGLASRLGHPLTGVPRARPAAVAVPATTPDRDAVAEAGRIVARRDGLHAVSVGSVAEELGTTMATVRQVAGDRDGVVVAMLDAVAAGLVVPAPSDDPRAEIIGLVSAAYEVLAADAWSVLAITMDGLAGPRVVPVVRRMLDAFRAAGVAEADVPDASRILWEHVYGAVLGRFETADRDTFAVRTAVAADLPVPPARAGLATLGLEIVVDGLIRHFS